MTRILSFSRPLLPVLLLVSLLPLNAQIESPLPPKSAEIIMPLPSGNVVMDPIPLAKIQAQDAVEDQYNQPLRFAWPFAVNLTMKDGTWTELADGSRIWRLRIDAPGARGMTLLYDYFFLPPGATLHLYNPNGNDRMGAFTQRNNTAGRRFATRVLDGDATVLEYYEPAAARGRGRIEIAQVGHAYRLMGTLKGLNDSGNCQVNVNCAEGAAWQDEKKGVARIVVNGTSLCTGGLLNNARGDGTPYFLTADHCIGGRDALGNTDASGWVFYWDYERPACANSGAVPRRTTAGATLVANSDESDMALFRLTEDPNRVHDVYFNGWSRAFRMIRGGVGIHHPAGDAKKIATHDLVPGSQGSPDHTFLRVLWDSTPNGHSVTEGGSSGSPIFDANSRVLGQLLGGSALNCTDPANDQGLYGRIYYSWNREGRENDPRRRLQDWLDPDGTDTVTVDGGYIAPAPPRIGFVRVQTLGGGAPVSEATATQMAAGGDCRPFTDVDVRVTTDFPLDSPYSGTVAVKAGTATAGLDFALLTSQFTLTPAAPSASVTVRVYDDDALETPEDLQLVLRGPATGNGGIGPDSLYTLSIESDELPVTPIDSSTVLFEDWAAGLPADWTVIDGGSTPTTWAVIDQFNGGSLNGSNFVFFDSDGDGDGETHDETLLSPVYDVTDMLDLRLSFSQYFRAYNLGDFERAIVSVFDGTAWVDVYELNEDSGNVGEWFAPDVPDLDLTPYRNAQLQIRFRFTAGYDWWWAIDDVRLSGTGNVRVRGQATPDPIEIYLGPNATVPVRDPAGRVLATVENLSGHDYGCTTVALTRGNDGQAAYLFSTNSPRDAALARALRIIPTNNSVTGRFRIRFYLEPDEISDYEDVTGNDFTDMVLVKVAGTNVEDVTPANFAGQMIDYGTMTTGSIGAFNWVEAIFDTGFSGFTVAPNTTDASLPVSWLDFRGEPRGKVNHLEWRVANQQNNHYFTVEHGTDGSNFSARTRVQWDDFAAVVDQAHIFTYPDESPNLGVNFYRIRQTDYDGNFTFSEVIRLINDTDDLGGVVANPVRDGLLQIRTTERTREAHLFTANGRLIRRAITTGAGLTELPVADLPAGVYLLRFGGEGGTSRTERVIIR